MTSLAAIAATVLLGLALAAADPAAAQSNELPASAPEPAPRSVVIGITDRLRVIGVPSFADGEVCMCEIYEAEFDVLRSLEGPPVGRRAIVRFVGHAFRERQEDFIVLMSVMPNDYAEGFWAGEAWTLVNRGTCLVHDERGWSEAEPDERGRRPDCTPVSTLVRPNRL